MKDYGFKVGDKVIKDTGLVGKIIGFEKGESEDEKAINYLRPTVLYENGKVADISLWEAERNFYNHCQIGNFINVSDTDIENIEMEIERYNIRIKKDKQSLKDIKKQLARIIKLNEKINKEI